MATKSTQRPRSSAAPRTAAKKRATARAPRSSLAAKRPVRAAVLGSAGSAVKQGIEVSMKGLEKIEVEIAKLVRRAVADTLRTGGSIAKDLTSVVHDVVGGAIQATEQAGTGLAVSIKGVARGAVAGVHDVQGNVAKAAAEIVKTAMKQAHKVGAGRSTASSKA